MNFRKMNDCSPWKSIFAKGSYFSMTLCVAIATVATQERKKMVYSRGLLALQ